MELLKRLRHRRAMIRLGDDLLRGMPHIENEGMSRSIHEHNNYFTCAFLTHEIERAIKNKHYDRLRVYARYIDGRYSYEAVTNAVIALRSLTSEPVDTVITDGHVVTAQNLIEAFHKQGRHSPVDINDYYCGILLLSYSAPDASERITSIVADRGITGIREIMDIVEQGEAAPEPLSVGAL